MSGDDNSEAFAQLDKMIEACRSMPGMAEREAPRVTALLREVVAHSVASGTSPEGDPWKPTQDGHMPLRGAMSAVTVEPAGDGVDVLLEGYHVFHQRGTKSKAANKAARAAGRSRRSARSAAKEARQANKKVSAAEKSIARQIEKRGKTTKRAAEKLAFAQSAAKRMQARAGAEAGHASTMGGRANAQAGVGGLPARPIIPASMPMTLSSQLRELFKQRWEEHMSLEGAA